MKKILFGIIAVLAIAVCATVYAGTADSECVKHEETHVHSTAEGKGACTYGTCKCKGFVQRPGYYQCWCGHQSFVHK